MPHLTAPELQAYFQQHGVTEVECVFPDISGYPRGKLMPAAAFAAGQALRICQAIPMQAVTGDYSYDPVFPDADPDVQLVPDLATLRLSPWASQPRAVVIHDCVELDGTPCLCERQLLGDTFVTGFCAFKALEHNSYLNEISAGERRVLLPLV